MQPFLKPMPKKGLGKAKRPSLVLVVQGKSPAGYPSALLVQREKDENQAFTLLQGELDLQKESYSDAALRILQNHFEMPKASASSPIIKTVGKPLGYIVHQVPKERGKGTIRTLIYLPVFVSMKIKVRDKPAHENPATNHMWILGRQIDDHASLMTEMREYNKWEAHVEALRRVLRPQPGEQAVRHTHSPEAAEQATA